MVTKSFQAKFYRASLWQVCVCLYGKGGGVYKYDKDMKFKWVFIYKS